MYNTWNGKPSGNTGKGSKSRICDQEKVNATMERVECSGFKKRCSSCDCFKGVDLVGYAICKKDVRFNINSDDECQEWERNR